VSISEAKGRMYDLQPPKGIKRKPDQIAENDSAKKINRQQQTTLLDNNYFNIIRNCNDNDESNTAHPVRYSNRQPAKTSAGQTKKNQKPPPIIVKGAKINVIRDIIDKNRIEGCSIKMTSDGIKVFTCDINSHKQMKGYLENNNLQYYTHMLREEQLSKFTIHGLHQVDPKELESRIEKDFKKPAHVKQIPIRNKRHEDHCIYIVAFSKKDNVKLSDLKELNTIEYMRVKWEHYKYRRTGPTQCNNCQMLGHGSSNCKLASRCIRCADSHNSKECPLIRENGIVTKNKIAVELLKCALCDKNHSANYSNCEARKMYQAKNRNRASEVRRPHTQTENNRFTAAPQLNEFNFPRLNRNADFTAKPSTNDPIWVSEETTSSPNDTSELFTLDQLTSIFMDMMHIVKTAKTKQQQLQMVMNSVHKYSRIHNV